jgi:hypothetical protein
MYSYYDNHLSGNISSLAWQSFAPLPIFAIIRQSIGREYSANTRQSFKAYRSILITIKLSGNIPSELGKPFKSREGGSCYLTNNQLSWKIFPPELWQSFKSQNDCIYFK